MAENNLFQVEIICPDHMFYQGEASMIEFNTSEGQVGILKNHVPETLIVRPGIVVITDGQKKQEAALHGGFAEVLKDKVTILAQAAEWPREIDVARAEEAKERAQKRLSDKRQDLDVLRAELSLKRALVRLDLTKNK